MPGGLRSRLHVAFEASLLLKGLFAAVETMLGGLLFLIPNQSIVQAVHWLTIHEITEDPNDPIAMFLLAQVQGYTGDVQNFYAFYLAGHGVLKLMVVLLLARGILWAYPAAVVVLSGFIAYQVHRYMLQPGIGLILLSLLDLAVIALTLIEYRALKARLS